MALSKTWCSRCVGSFRSMIKYGETISGNQRYFCKRCHKTRAENYVYKAYQPNITTDIIILTKEGLGIRSTATLLKI